MLKKILIALGIVGVLLLILFLYANHRNRTLSPPASASITVNNLEVAVSYSRPSVKGRLIFGEEADGALLPFGKYWRLGANEATEITFNQDVNFNGIPLKAGTYRLYAIPGPETFKIGVNTKLGRWGAWEPDYTKDLFVTEVPANRLSDPVEQFTIRMEPWTSDGVMLFFQWSDTQFTIPISAQLTN